MFDASSTLQKRSGKHFILSYPRRMGSPIVAELISLQATAPRRSAWSLYDHCAAITRLYAVFEGFVDALVQEYLEALPAIYPIYVELPAPIATQHRLGVAQILSKLGDSRLLFKHLTEQETLKGISAGNAGSPYTLLADAFLTDQQNYRAEQLNKIFGYLNLNNIWAGVEKHPAVAFYMTSRDPGEKPPRNSQNACGGSKPCLSLCSNRNTINPRTHLTRQFCGSRGSGVGGDLPKTLSDPGARDRPPQKAICSHAFIPRWCARRHIHRWGAGGWG